MKTDKMVAMSYLMLAFLVWNFSGNGLAGNLADRISAFGSFAPAADTVGLPRVPYVPTPTNVVEKMLEMADVGKDDLVYDLGCGDGRIVITAARDRGARGVGVDINPERIRECRQNAKDANVSDRVDFLEQDLFITDLSGASVVTLYLLPSVNLELRPKLLEELEAGTRVVSHDFDMGEWNPDQYAAMGTDKIYFWVVPANVSGTWEWKDTNAGGEARYRLVLEQSFQEVNGTLLTENGSAPIEEARLKGDRLEFTVRGEADGRSAPVRYEGRVRENTMEIRRAGDESAATRVAERDPETVAPLDAPAVNRT